MRRKNWRERRRAGEIAVSGARTLPSHQELRMRFGDGQPKTRLGGDKESLRLQQACLDCWRAKFRGDYSRLAELPLCANPRGFQGTRRRGPPKPSHQSRGSENKESRSSSPHRCPLKNTSGRYFSLYASPLESSTTS